MRGIRLNRQISELVDDALAWQSRQTLLGPSPAVISAQMTVVVELPQNA